MSARPAHPYSQAARLHDVIRLIEARRGLTIDELVLETGVARRTVYRDLEAIEVAGYPLVSEWQGNRKVYSFITGFKDVPPIRFSLPELMTLSLFRSQLDFLQGTPFYNDMEAIARKVHSALPPRYAAHLERMAGVAMPILSGRRDYAKNADALEKLREALLFQYRVFLAYAARGRKTVEQYDVDPYTLILHKGGLYLIGYAHNRSSLRTFALERIMRTEISTKRFTIPDDFRVDDYLKHSFGIVQEKALPVRIRFSATAAESIREKIWHPSQVITDEPDGGILLSFYAGGSMEIIAWVLSWGIHAELLQPPELREVLREISVGLAIRYHT